MDQGIKALLYFITIFSGTFLAVFLCGGGFRWLLSLPKKVYKKYIDYIHGE